MAVKKKTPLPWPPRRLKKDAIVEALFEIRFRTNQPEQIVVGRLSDKKEWKKYTVSRTAFADVPAQIRNSNPALKFHAIVDLVAPDRTRTIKIGANIVSYHVLKKYCGWTQFKTELDDLVAHLEKTISDISIERLGLRYLNALTSDAHHITSVSDLNLAITLATQPITDPLNIAVLRKISSEFMAQYKVASVEFIQGNIPTSTVALVDVDVYTPAGFVRRGVKSISKWLERAHTYEKEIFFSILPRSIVIKLQAE
ncbi:MAG: TIGR04255 family protein [Reyranellaceae bacterium]